MTDQPEIEHAVDHFIAEVLSHGYVPSLPAFLGEDWEPLATELAEVLNRFERSVVVQVDKDDSGWAYVQLMRKGDDILAEAVSNEFADGSSALSPQAVSMLIESGWEPPEDSRLPNFFRLFRAPIITAQLAWQILQTLHAVYGAVPEDTWSTSPVPGAAGDFVDADEGEAMDLSELTWLEGPTDTVPQFAMPKAVSIIGRFSPVTNSFANSIIPVIKPTDGQVREALEILGMADSAVCAYCGDPATEWDHLRPLIIEQKPTGFISEIHNLVPACGKCNQSKGNKPWRAWMFNSAKKSPATGTVPGLVDTRGLQ